MANTIILPFSELQAELNDEAMIDPNAVIDITENGLYNVAKYGYANVNVEGGGESDYSVATVTIINQMNAPYKIALPTLDENLELSGFALVLPAPIPQNFDVVLKSGKVVTDREDLPIYSATGDIQYTEELLTITGDGSITLADTV